MRWTAASSSFCWLRYAVPRSCIQSRSSFIFSIAAGTPQTAFTLGSQSCDFKASSSAASLSEGFFLSQRAASTTSSG
jgi:hypothetical protein